MEQPQKKLKSLQNIEYSFRWIHDYQDACVDKLERFLKGEVNTSDKKGAIFHLGSSTDQILDRSPCKYSSSESTPSSEATTPNIQLLMP